MSLPSSDRLAARLAPRLAALSLVVALAPALPLRAQSLDPRLFAEMRWRPIGPFRGGRTKAAAGVPGRPGLFYVGVVNGGVLRTTDYGRTWEPIFDDQPTGSIGALAVAPSDPNVIYVGSGEGLQRPDLSTGDGIYKSTDAGRTWTHLGLRDGQQIPQIVVDPRDPNRLFVAVLGHPYGANAERGVYRSTDGGRTFERVLYRDENTGAVDVVMDPRDANTLYAALWESRQAPWENGVFQGPGSGLYKSTDGGASWRRLTSGLPTFEADGLGRIGVTVAPSDPRRLYATVDAARNGGLYRSDDAGETWRRATDDPRFTSRGSDFAEVKVDPRNPDVVYTGSIVAWKSTDGGRTFAALRGAPGGDDYHRFWISPDDPNVILLASDQGAVITVNGGQTWSSWYNQSTAQLYHVSADDAFPYRVCGGQQESGSACVRSRSDDGRITFRDWHPVGVEEYGYVAADPLDPDIVYGGKVTRYDRRTGQVKNVAPRLFRSADYRALRTAPVLFSPVNPRALYFATNVVWRTTNGGTSWTQISPDLTRGDSVVPPNVGRYASSAAATARHPGVVYTLAPSYLTERVLWAGTDDGLVQLTTDAGATWRDVTPPEVRARPWSKISVIDASRFDSLGAYVAVNTFRLDDLRPHVYRTHDGGRTWQRVVAGIDSGAVINAVREDPRRRGLLYAAGETQVWVSFDDGDRWQSLRLDMPATSIRDVVVKDDDLVAGTHGRGFWILDDVTPLRQIDARTAAAPAVLFRPQTAVRFRHNKNTDTPLPVDEPGAPNPPDGAVVDYWLAADVPGPVTLEVLDAAGRLVRRYASTDTAMAPADIGMVPRWWIRPTQVLSARAGMHRFVWDLRWPAPAVLATGYPIAATPRDTPREPRGVWVQPGRYTVRLTANGRAYTQPLDVRMDPRVKTTAAGLARQFALSMRVDSLLSADMAALREVQALRARLSALGPRLSAADSTPAAAIERGLGALESGGGDNLARLNGELGHLFGVLQEVDAEPTTQTVAALGERERALRAVLERWRRLREGELTSLDRRLRAAGMGPLLNQD